MTEELQTSKKNEATFLAGGEEISLTPNIVRQFVTKGNGDITTEEAFNFIQLCRYSGLNPFLNEAYIIKFGTQPAQMIVSKEAFMKRAERQKQYQGFEAGVIAFNEKTGEVNEREGAFLLPTEQVVGGWAKVYRSDRERPVTVKISFSEFAKYKNGGTLQSTWASMPANMIRKSAIVNALREAFPDQLGAMYTEDEPNPADIKPRVDVTELNQDDKKQSLLDGFKAEKQEVKEEPKEQPKEEAKEIVNVEPIKDVTAEPEEAANATDSEVEEYFEEVGLFEPEVKSKL